MKKITITLLITIPVSLFLGFALGGLAQREAYKNQLNEAISLIGNGVDFSGIDIDIERDPLSQTIAKIWGHGSVTGYSMCSKQ